MSEVVKNLELALAFQKNAAEGIISFDDTPTSQSKVEKERATVKEDCNGVDRAEKSVISKKKVAARKFSNDMLLGNGGLGNVYKGWHLA
ncbi:hypothetical protein P3S68_009673 [Capsicum galapagoense]